MYTVECVCLVRVVCTHLLCVYLSHHVVHFPQEFPQTVIIYCHRTKLSRRLTT